MVRKIEAGDDGIVVVPRDLINRNELRTIAADDRGIVIVYPRGWSEEQVRELATALREIQTTAG